MMWIIWLVGVGATVRAFVPSHPMLPKCRTDIFPNKASVSARRRSPRIGRGFCLTASLKPAAEPLMAAGNRLAALGEAWIEKTRDTNVYGGSLSSAGANVRNAGDHVAQAAASCRFKTGTELIAEELREAGTALDAAADFLERTVDALEPGEDTCCGIAVEPMVAPMRACSRSLEASGAAVLHRESVVAVGAHLEEAGKAIRGISDDVANPMIRAGNNLQGKESPKPVGKSWLKGGGM